MLTFEHGKVTDIQLPKMCTLSCLVHIKSIHILTLCIDLLFSRYSNSQCRLHKASSFSSPMSKFAIVNHKPDAAQNGHADGCGTLQVGSSQPQLSPPDKLL